jgi:geranylgeranyl reductase family protein
MRYDAAVIGAGPAGAWAARELARRGARVALVDASHPREKPCGGGITGRALAIVGANVAGRVPRVSIETARFTSPRGVVDVNLPPGALVVASRSDFDRALLDAAIGSGAALVPARARDVTFDTQGATVTTTAGAVRADVVIGADGAAGLLRRRVASRLPRADWSLATGFFAHGVTSREIVIGMNADPPGYFWSFPRPSHLAIGVCAQADSRAEIDALRTAVVRWMKEAGLGDASRLEAYSWPIPSLSPAALRKAVFAGPRWLLVGDAAGLVDPLTREGIYFALLSGAWAADAVAESPRAFARNYDGRIRQHIVAELAHAAQLKTGFFRPAFTELVMSALHESAEIRSVMASLVAGEQSYAGLKWRLLRTRQFALAARFFVSAVRGLLSGPRVVPPDGPGVE